MGEDIGNSLKTTDSVGRGVVDKVGEAQIGGVQQIQFVHECRRGANGGDG